MPGKFSSARDELLYHMSLDGWANAHCGETDSPMGYVARISNEPADIASVRDAFPEQSKGIKDADIIGHFLCAESSQGFWFVQPFENEAQLLTVFRQFELAYEDWDSQDD